jgi:hypothetical protein
MPTGSSTLGCVAIQPAPSSESRDGRHGCSRPEQSFSSPSLSGSNALRPCGPRIKV